ncbi:MAG: HEPN domain-containing protein [Methanomicrobiales archaeon]
MASIDIKRARKLLKSAKDLYEKGDINGVAGLGYAAFESATMALTTETNGTDYHNHYLRRKRAKQLLKKYQDKIDFLWEVRNIDFYGNVKANAKKREISYEEVEMSLKVIETIIDEIEKILKKI